MIKKMYSKLIKFTDLRIGSKTVTLNKKYFNYFLYCCKKSCQMLLNTFCIGA